MPMFSYYKKNLKNLQHAFLTLVEKNEKLETKSSEYESVQITLIDKCKQAEKKCNTAYT